MNTVNLIGRLVRENELRYTQSGKAVATNTLAIDDGWGDNKKTYFIPFTIWDKSAESLANYTKKGSKIAISGKITSRSYETKDGQKRTVIEVVANQYGGIEFLDAKQSESQSNKSRNGNAGRQTNNTKINFGVEPMDRHNDPFGGSSIEISDNLPF